MNTNSVLFQQLLYEYHEDKLWEVFELGLAYSAEPTDSSEDALSLAFDEALTQGWEDVEISMCLYLARHFTFLSLDKFTSSYIDNSQILSNLNVFNTKNWPNGRSYLQVCEVFTNDFKKPTYQSVFRFRSFPELSYLAKLYTNNDTNQQEPEQTEDQSDQYEHQHGLKLQSKPTFPAYTKTDFLNEIFMSEDNYDKLVSLLNRKKNLILLGAAGVGKTFTAERLAFSIMGEENPNHVKMEQFHQSYSYEDFIQGFKPNGSGGFALKNGSFYKFCKKAEQDAANQYFFIIDEINRGNMSKIFGGYLC